MATMGRLSRLPPVEPRGRAPRRNGSVTLWVAAAAGLEAAEAKAAARLWAAREGPRLDPFSATPVGRALTRRLVPPARSRRNTPGAGFPAAGPVRSGASEVKATYRPSPLIEGSRLAPVA